MQAGEHDGDGGEVSRAGSGHGCTSCCDAADRVSAEWRVESQGWWDVRTAVSRTMLCTVFCAATFPLQVPKRVIPCRMSVGFRGATWLNNDHSNPATGHRILPVCPNSYAGTVQALAGVEENEQAAEEDEGEAAGDEAEGDEKEEERPAARGREHLKPKHKQQQGTSPELYVRRTYWAFVAGNMQPRSSGRIRWALLQLLSQTRWARGRVAGQACGYRYRGCRALWTVTGQSVDSYSRMWCREIQSMHARRWYR